MHPSINSHFLYTACLLACVTGHAYEQDNWYEVFDIPLSDDDHEASGLYNYVIVAMASSNYM